MDLEALLDEADQALADGRPEDALRLAGQARKRAPDDPDAVFLEAEALLDLGRFPEAARRYARADALLPDTPTILTGLAIAEFEQARIDQAERLLRRAVALEGREPLADAHFFLGLVLERRGAAGEAARHFARARRLAPESYPAPSKLDRADFDAATEAALAELPPRVAAALQNVTVSVLPLPAEEELQAAEPPLSPQILGMWRGTALTQKTVFDPWSELPGHIELYQKNLERACRTRDELVEQIRITVLHEVGHALGLDEEDLAERGLD
jgi:predicted Zn-dependent protease with MMP-like domain